MSSALDKVIRYISPSMGLRRAHARAHLTLVENKTRAYEGAKTGRRTSGWTTGGTSANAEINTSLSALRNRSRDLRRNNAYAAKALSSRVANLIGTGIVAKFSDDTAQALWKQFVRECDADGQHDLYGLQKLAAETMEESGEVLIRLRWRRPEDGLAVPLQLQVLEPDYIDTMKIGDLPNGGWIINGIEFDAIGKRVAYWLFKQHPGEQLPYGTSFISVRVPAEQIIHAYEKTRPGQNRGVPRLTPSMLTYRDADDLEDAELLRKGLEACFVGVITGSEDGNTMVPSTIERGGDSTAADNRIESISAGMFYYPQGGENITFGQPHTQAGFAEYMRTVHHKQAAGSKVTYEQMTGDHSQVNYSSIRAGLVEQRRENEQWQWLTFIPMVCDPIARAFLMACRLSGKLKTREPITVTHQPPRWDWVDPYKDVNGALLECAGGLKPWQDAVRERGLDPDEVLAKIKEDQDKFAAAGITIKLTDLVLGAAASPANNTDGAKNA